MVDWLSTLFMLGDPLVTVALVYFSWLQIRKQFPSDTKVAIKELTDRLALLEKHESMQDTDIAVILSELQNMKDGAERTIDAVNRIEDRINRLER